MQQLGADNLAESMGELGEDGGSEDDDFSHGAPTFPLSSIIFPVLKTVKTIPAVPLRAAAKRKRKKIKTENTLTFIVRILPERQEVKLTILSAEIKKLSVLFRFFHAVQRITLALSVSGVGKTAIAEGLALRIADGNVPQRLKNKEIHLLDLASLVAGTQFRGQFESRIKGLVAEVKENGNIILFIDEVHTLVGTGDNEGTMNAANILKPALSRGEVQVIGATTFNEYRKYIRKRLCA